MKRRSLFRVHQWIGLVVFVLVLLSATTGSVLLFREQLKSDPPRTQPVEQPLSLEELAAIAVASGDGSPATDIGLPLAPGDPYKVWLDDDAETLVYLDGRGKVLGTRREAEGFTRWLFRLHTGDVVGGAGMLLSLVTGLGLCLMVWSGLSMLWARRRARGGRIKRASAREEST